jgi:predicted metallo-beta-lactamase superfamily hydrolase
MNEKSKKKFLVLQILTCVYIRNPEDERTTRKVKRIIDEIHQIRVINHHLISPRLFLFI